MKFKVYINKKNANEIKKFSKSLKRSHNSILNEALKEWLLRYDSSKWPKNFFEFEPIEDVPDFKSYRKEFTSH